MSGRVFMIRRAGGSWDVWELLGHPRAVFRPDLSIVGGCKKTKAAIRQKYPGARVEICREPALPGVKELASSRGRAF